MSAVFPKLNFRPNTFCLSSLYLLGSTINPTFTSTCFHLHVPIVLDSKLGFLYSTQDSPSYYSSIIMLEFSTQAITPSSFGVYPTMMQPTFLVRFNLWDCLIGYSFLMCDEQSFFFSLFFVTLIIFILFFKIRFDCCTVYIGGIGWWMVIVIRYPGRMPARLWWRRAGCVNRQTELKCHEVG